MYKQFNYKFISINKKINKWLSAVLFHKDESKRIVIRLKKQHWSLFHYARNKADESNLTSFICIKVSIGKMK